MCTAVLSVEAGLPVLLAGVRDELTDRAWVPPARHWPEYPGLVGGRDLVAGGTWLAVAPRERRVACVLNGRGQPAPPGSRRSRGVLPLRAAAGAELGRSLAGFDPFHLLTAEPGLAIMQSWDGEQFSERELGAGLHIVVNSGLAGDLMADDRTGRAAARSQDGRAAARPQDGQAQDGQAQDGRSQDGRSQDGQAQDGRSQDGRAQDGQAPDGRDHELARIGHFLPLFASAARPLPRPGESVERAWGDWLPLVDGAGLGTDDRRALIVRHDLGGGRIWGTTSVSLVALSPAGVRYDFSPAPGEQSAWYPVPAVPESTTA